MNLTEFEDIVNLSERLLMQTKNNIMTVDEFGYWTEGVLLVELIFRLFLTLTSLPKPDLHLTWTWP